MKLVKYAILFIFLVCTMNAAAQKVDSSWYWHNMPREIRYHPEETDFVITNGKRRFTRALYETNTAFRVEGGNLPEFGLYMPGMGGNIKFGLIKNDSSKWLISVGKITARYRPGKMICDIEDDLLGKAIMHLEGKKGNRDLPIDDKDNSKLLHTRYI